MKAFAHVCFIVKDLDASIDFYCSKLGMTHCFDFQRDSGERFGVYLHVGGRSFVELFIGTPEAPPSPVSFQHTCLEVDDLTATVTDLRAKGVEVTDPYLGMDHSWQSWLADPDGNRIELHCYTDESWQLPHVR